MSYQMITMPNGIRVVTKEMPHMDSVSLGLWVLCGSRYETKSLGGISHFIEHMLFKGTKKRKAREISESIEGIGGMLNAFTTEENTCYLTKVPEKYFSLGLEVLADMYLNPTFPLQELEREKQVVKEEIKMYLDLPSQYVHDILNSILWPEHPLGRLILGTEKSIKRLSRKHLFAYKEQHYVAHKTVLAVAGKITRSEVVNKANKLLGSLSPGNSGNTLLGNVLEEKQEKVRVSILPKKTEQAHLCLGIRTFKREHPDRYTLSVLNTILGDNMSSRLFQEVREKHSLAYEIHSSIDRYRDTGSLVVSAGVEAGKLLQALEIIMKELTKLAEKAVSLKELNRAKDYIEGQLVMNLEKTTNSMLSLGDSLLNTGKVITKEEIVGAIRKVTAKDIMRVAQALFKDTNLNLAVIGTIKNEDSIVRRLHF